jgi:hypothetical protein
MSILLRTKQREVINQKNLYYARLEGNDSNNGKSLEYAKATAQGLVAAAIANSPPPSPTNRGRAVIVDGGPYLKFSMSGGGFVALDAEETGFYVLITPTSQLGIQIDDGYTVDLGYVYADGASTAPGTIVDCLAGPNRVFLNIRQIVGNASQTHILLKSSSDEVFSNIEEIRQPVRNEIAIQVAGGTFRLENNKSIRGLLQVGDNRHAYIESVDFDGDVELGVNSRLFIGGQRWTGKVISAGVDAEIHDNFTTRVIP